MSKAEKQIERLLEEARRECRQLENHYQRALLLFGYLQLTAMDRQARAD